MKRFTISERTKDRLATLARFIVIIPILSLGSQVCGWVHSVWAEHWLRKDAKPVAAIVTEVHPKRVLGYRYTVNGKTFTGKGSRDWQEDRDHPMGAGEMTTALVSASHPSFSCLDMSGTAWIGLPFMVLIMIFELFCLGVLADGILRLFFGIRFRNEQPEDSIAILIFASVFALFLTFAAFALRRNRSRQVRFYRIDV
jgi:hypothetical protein